jgi:hypothetical protein
VIHVPINSTPLSTFHFSFYLYHILKEPIPFQILCKILHHDDKIQVQQNLDCPSSSIDGNNNNNERFSINKRDYSSTLFRSSSVYVTRQLPSTEFEQEIFQQKSSFFDYLREKN